MAEKNDFVWDDWATDEAAAIDKHDDRQTAYEAVRPLVHQKICEYLSLSDIMQFEKTATAFVDNQKYRDIWEWMEHFDDVDGKPQLLQPFEYRKGGHPNPRQRQ